MQLSNGHCGVVLGSIMQKQTRHTDVSAPQSVTDFIQIQTAEKSIKIGFTDRKISPHAGLSAFAAFLHWHRFKSHLAAALLKAGLQIARCLSTRCNDKVCDKVYRVRRKI